MGRGIDTRVALFFGGSVEAKKPKGLKSQRNKATNINHMSVSAVRAQIDGAFIAALF